MRYSINQQQKLKSNARKKAIHTMKTIYADKILIFTYDVFSTKHTCDQWLLQKLAFKCYFQSVYSSIFEEFLVPTTNNEWRRKKLGEKKQKHEYKTVYHLPRYVWIVEPYSYLMTLVRSSIIKSKLRLQNFDLVQVSKEQIYRNGLKFTFMSSIVSMCESWIECETGD